MSGFRAEAASGWSIAAAAAICLAAAVPFRPAAAQTAAAAPAAAPAAPAAGSEPDRTTILEENDSLYFNSDKHYTQGLRASDLLGGPPSPGGLWDHAFGLVSHGPFFEPGGRRRVAIFIGQSLFTPKNLSLKPPPLNDRPYAGYAYVGASLLQESHGDMLENAEIDLGMVGPGALGQATQNDFHQFIGAERAQGWSSQLQQEFGGMLTYERMWRLPLFGDNSFGADVVPEIGATAGNIFTYGDIGGMLRIGKGLHADYGPIRIRPALSGTDYFDANGLDNGHGFYFFVGTQGRAVGHNIFLDGNTFRTSRNVPKKVLVGDVEAGFSFIWSRSLRMDFSVTRRSEEFRGQKTPDAIGSAALTFNW